MNLRALLQILLYFVLINLSVTVTANDKLSMDKLLEQVKQGLTADAEINKQREADFKKDQSKQEARIRAAMQEVAALEAKSAELENTFNENELIVEEKRQQRDERLGSLKELFGHLTATAADSRSRFQTSITTNQFPEREQFLTDLIKKMSSETDLPSIEEIEQVWYELHREMTESGKVVKYKAQVGTEKDREVVRVGLFNLISNGDYLAYNTDTRTVSALPRQPSGQRQTLLNLQGASTGYTDIAIDPTGAAGGGFLKAIINTPTMIERWHQGKLVGYIITVIGALALLIALWRFMALNMIYAKILKQLKVKKPLKNNPLGRILAVAEANPKTAPETLELKLDEAILTELPKIQSGLNVLKIIAMVAPLLGLLGTVVGMIIVFQAITIYGAGDPKAMAGGISSALVTTVLGLIVAIPTLLLHTFLQSKAKKILHILEEQSAGIVAERAGL